MDLQEVPTLRTIREWSEWVSKFTKLAVLNDSWDKFQAEGRVAWLEKPSLASSERKWRRYEEQREQRNELASWILEHVSGYLASRLMSLDTYNPTVMYDKLIEMLNITQRRLDADAFVKYEEAMEAMSQRPTDLADWVETWLQRMIQSRAAGVHNALNTLLWWHDLERNISKVFPDWCGFFIVAGSLAINDGSLTFEAVADDLLRNATLRWYP